MTDDERAAIRLIQGGVELLRNAAIKGDPHREIELRARDILADLEGVMSGKARMVASFALPSGASFR
jgi:hypothetical protein